MNLFVGLSTAIVSFAILVILLIFFTPLREYVPGYTDNQTKRNIRYLLYKTDSLEKNLQAKEAYYKNLLNIVNGGTGIADGNINAPKK
jgi:hypothetical protein